MVFEMLRSMIAEAMGCEEDEITTRSDLRDDLGLSDTELQEIMDAMGGELGFRYDEDDLEKIQTMAQLVRYISRLV